MDRTAIFSTCKNYRFVLTRSWDNSRGHVVWIMLNPSTSDAIVDDPTIRRCIQFSQSWGFGSLAIVNLFPYRTPHPKLLAKWKIRKEIMELNESYIGQVVNKADLILCAWGNGPIIKKMNFHSCAVSNIDKQKLFCIKLSIHNVPMHPLYLKGNLTPIPLGNNL